ncbi:CLIP domain-containing serine protease B4-like [Anopheles cruzii]|uniref:CLIP domain-containing serine protease B4-like n=1 Tax=Anopheles cruzii TaxID=68878 RepID=UPI0022EC63FC|nr:CLIP domain-containing serine protease B4-like [Anopheles cruzii]
MVLVTVLVALLGLVASTAGTPSLSPGDVCRINGNVGRCVPIPENPEYSQLLRTLPRSEDQDRYLERFICDRRQKLTCRLGSVNDELCGIQMADRIVRGERAALDQYPWMALMQYEDHRKGKKRFACGGTLLNRKFVLSAAHCFVRLQAGLEFIKVRLGEWNTETELDCEEDAGEEFCAPPVQDFGYEKLLVHEGYSGNYADRANDIALIQLDGVVQYNEFVKPICLPEPSTRDREKLYSGSLWAAGWGRTESSPGSSYKLFVALDYYDLGQCNETYRKKVRIPLTGTQFCALGVAGKDTCNGDSGGPLMKTLKSLHYAAGVVSFGPQKCGSPVPAVYTKVEAFYQWIVDRMVLYEDRY